MAKRDPHDVLGVPRSAPVKEIRRAYRDLARQLHPDASGTPETADAFHQATVAYNELKKGDGEAIPIAVSVGSPSPARAAVVEERPRARVIDEELRLFVRNEQSEQLRLFVRNEQSEQFRLFVRNEQSEQFASRTRVEAEPLVAPSARWRRTESQDLAPDLDVDADLELLLRLLRAGYFPW